ncbi:LEUCINE-RICH REPEAT RECEPTOR PROTEIN KINASE MSL1-LIKE [Salix purpurea]|uniref:LEUCINE-RICH REPEAT RECEPTOR PROTEIN KINASE MSL1-LIKE n=1 Tax=Salix purpurea TaxID=77065 RepID=A0A9Q0WXW4_SALPP|nr:LEUCINE-RICH REPEAT RECEPTOR PROTEIN KINASE MSL1-LIKE [Salix purpurea]
MSNSSSEDLNVETPNFLHNQHDLRVLDLSQNNFIGMFPSWLLKNNTRLEQIFLSENSFDGALQLQDHPNPDMTTIDISDNNMHVELEQFTTLTFLDLSKNNLGGQLPASVVNSSRLNYLSLSDNYFRGQLSDFPSPIRTMWPVLDLSNNQFSGTLPRWFVNSTQLFTLDLSKNHFDGPIPEEFWKVSRKHRWISGFILDQSL